MEDYTVITKSDDHRSVRLDIEAVKRYIKNAQIGTKRFCIISIAGQARKGKSFTMNLIRQFIENSGSNDKHWLGDTIPFTMFPLAKRRHAGTKAITLSKPIAVNWRHDNDTMMVILMDTPGICSNAGSESDDHFVLSLAALMSSIQFYNAFEYIQSNDLTALQKADDCVDLIVPKLCKQPNRKKQHLCILVRDARDEYDANCSSDPFRGIRLSKELEAAWDKLKKSYKSVTSYTLTRPGERCSEWSQRDEVSTREIREPFLSKLSNILKSTIRSSEAFRPKMAKNQPMTMSDLLQAMIQCDKFFDVSHQRTTSVATLDEDCESIECQNHSQEIVRAFSHELDVLQPDGMNVTNQCQTLVNDALQKFEERVSKDNPGLQSKDSFKAVRKDLELQLKDTMNEWKLRNGHDSNMYEEDERKPASVSSLTAAYENSTKVSSGNDGKEKTGLKDGRTVSKIVGSNKENYQQGKQQRNEEGSSARLPDRNPNGRPRPNGSAISHSSEPFHHTSNIQSHAIGGEKHDKINKDTVLKWLDDRAKQGRDFTMQKKHDQAERNRGIHQNLKKQLKELDATWAKKLQSTQDTREVASAVKNEVRNDQMPPWGIEMIDDKAHEIKGSAVKKFWQENLKSHEIGFASQLNRKLWQLIEKDVGSIFSPLEELEFLIAKDVKMADIRKKYPDHGEEIDKIYNEFEKDWSSGQRTHEPRETDYGELVTHCIMVYCDWCSTSLSTCRQLLEMALANKKDEYLNKTRSAGASHVAVDGNLGIHQIVSSSQFQNAREEGIDPESYNLKLYESKIKGIGQKEKKKKWKPF